MDSAKAGVTLMINKIQLCKDDILEGAVRLTEPPNVSVDLGIILPPVVSIRMGGGYKNGKGTGYGLGTGSGYVNGDGDGHPNDYGWGDRYGDVQNNFR